MADLDTHHESRVLVLAPTSRDEELTCAILHKSGLGCFACKSIHQLTLELAEGAGALLLTDRVLQDAGMPELVAWLEAQPAWSEIPIVMLMHGGLRSQAAGSVLASLKNVTLLERPASKRSVVSVVTAAVKNRQRQYRLRDNSLEREQLLANERSARADAERANRSKDEFLALLSHELKSPLNAITMAAQLLGMEGVSEDERDAMVHSINHNARMQNQLIEDLLDITRMASGKLRLTSHLFDLREVVTSAVGTTRPALEAKRLEVSWDCAQEPVLIYGDSDRIQQVVWNLLGNAAKFTPEGGRISLSVGTAKGNAIFSVRDSGCGIEPAVLPQLFDRFRQATSGIARTHGGLGLGLSIVRQLVDLHGGSVSGFSEGPGKGSTFTVRLPLAYGEIVEDLAAPSNDERRLAGLKVLVVDDDEGFGQLIQRLLREYDIEAHVATSVQDAFKAIEEFHPDLLLSDIGMPDTDGYEFVRQLRARGISHNDLPAAAVSAFGAGDNRARAIASGFQAYVSKPVEASALLNTLIHLTAQREHSDANDAPLVARGRRKPFPQTRTLETPRSDRSNEH